MWGNHEDIARNSLHRWESEDRGVDSSREQQNYNQLRPPREGLKTQNYIKAQLRYDLSQIFVHLVRPRDVNIVGLGPALGFGEEQE